MIVVSCQACHLRFEAPQSASPMGMCPACTEAGATPGGRTRSHRLTITPPSLAPDLSAIGAPARVAAQQGGAGEASDESGGPGEDAPGEDWTPIEPVFVDLLPAERPRASLRGAAITTMGLTLTLAVGAVLVLRGPIERWAPGSAPVYERVARLTGLDGGSSAGSPVAPLTATGSIAQPSTTQPVTKTLPDIAGGSTLVARSTAPADLAIRNVSTQIRLTDEGERLVVRGEVHNRAPGSAALPPLRVTIRDARGQARYRWKVGGGAKLKPGGVHTFTARSQALPKDAASVRVDFAPPR